MDVVNFENTTDLFGVQPFGGTLDLSMSEGNIVASLAKANLIKAPIYRYAKIINVMLASFNFRIFDVDFNNMPTYFCTFSKFIVFLYIYFFLIFFVFNSYFFYQNSSKISCGKSLHHVSVLSIFLKRNCSSSGFNNGGTITYGAVDSKNCKPATDYVDFKRDKGINFNTVTIEWMAAGGVISSLVWKARVSTTSKMVIPTVSITSDEGGGKSFLLPLLSVQPKNALFTFAFLESLQRSKHLLESGEGARTRSIKMGPARLQRELSSS